MTIETIELAINDLRYSALTAGEGPLVILLHGFPDCNQNLVGQIEAIAADGFRVLAPCLRGYEPSSQSPDGAYHVIDLASDVLGWMDALGEPQCQLIGHDWGALATYVAAALRPERFRSIATLAVPHLRHAVQGVAEIPEQLLNSGYILMMQLPGLSARFLARNDYALLEKLWARWSPGWTCSPEVMANVKATFARPGVADAATAYYRCLLSPLSVSAQQSWQLLSARLKVPTLALTGEKDGCIDSRLYDSLMKPEDFPAGLAVHRLPDCGHFLHLERPAEVNALLLEWLAKHRDIG